MTKYFCDICKKAVDYENSIQVHGWLRKTNSMYCVDCFQNNKNWKIIHGLRI